MVNPKNVVGIDVGGTFTDISVFMRDHERMIVDKVPTTPENLTHGIIAAFEKVANKVDNLDMEHAVLGTTVGTNAVLMRRGTKCVLLVTQGFRDILYIMRAKKPLVNDFNIDKPKPIITGEAVIEVQERIDAKGNIIQPLADNEIERVVERIEQTDADSVAVCFLHSYKNPLHEKYISKALKKINRDISITLSSDVSPQIGEYERCSTTAIEAYIKPILLTHLNAVSRGLEQRGVLDMFVIQSNGGVMRADESERRAISTLNSGPAAGVVGAAQIVKEIGIKNCISFDMGGTTCDVAIVRGGEPLLTELSQIDLVAPITSYNYTGLPVLSPTIDVVSVGAGGGSIARLDRAGVLQVGPESAGANPGPVCYGLGGDIPTVTDAHLLLGHLSSVDVQADRYKLNEQIAIKAMRTKVADPLGMSVEEVSRGILEISNTKMSNAIRNISIERGSDSREFTLVAFGGAGPLHAVEIARMLGIQQVLIPVAPGTFSAAGALASDLKYDFTRTNFHTLRPSAPMTPIFETYKQMEHGLPKIFSSSASNGHDIELSHQAVARYRGQGYGLEMKVSKSILEEGKQNRLVKHFHNIHERYYGYCRSEETVELVTLRIIAMRKFGIDLIDALRKLETEVGRQPNTIRERKVWHDGDFELWPVYWRTNLARKQNVIGPAIIEETTSTTIIPTQSVGQIDSFGNILISLESEKGSTDV